MVLWLFFAAAHVGRLREHRGQRELISKVYFPRMIIPIAAVVPAADRLLRRVRRGARGDLRLRDRPAASEILLMPLLRDLWHWRLRTRHRAVALGAQRRFRDVPPRDPVHDPRRAVRQPDHLPVLILSRTTCRRSMRSTRWSACSRLTAGCCSRAAHWPGAIILIPLGASVVLLVTGAVYFQRAETQLRGRHLSRRAACDRDRRRSASATGSAQARAAARS